MNNLNPLTIAISSGDPAGIGPEVALKALDDPEIRDLARWILVGDAWLLRETGNQFGNFPEFTVTDTIPIAQESNLLLWDVQQLPSSALTFGRVNPDYARAGLNYVRLATQLCLEGQAEAIVTAPLNKEAVSLAGIEFSGHTEYIAELCGVDQAHMLLINDQLSVVHVSTHCSLHDATRLSVNRILDTIRRGHEAFLSIRHKEPRVAVCGLNPHAGENGIFGDEEVRYIAPAVRAAAVEGIDCVGPLPADTLFVQAVSGKYDLIVVMYHDQGCIPMKLMDFEHTVNVTLGLPIIRTSVDHGTAFDIAGKKLANPSGMKSAMRFAVTMAQCREGVTG